MFLYRILNIILITFLVILSMLCLSCIALTPVARYPWVEDRTLQLDKEVLRIIVKDKIVTVDALFVFKEFHYKKKRAIFFPVTGEKKNVKNFRVQIEMPGREPIPIQVFESAKSYLPYGRGNATFDFTLPDDIFKRSGAAVRVTYSEKIKDEFTYILKTGSYWRGPIKSLLVIIRDDNNIIKNIMFEKNGTVAKIGTDLIWRFENIEPRNNISLQLN